MGDNRYLGSNACVKITREKPYLVRIDQIKPFDILCVSEDETQEVSGVEYFPAEYNSMCVVDWDKDYPIFVSTYIQHITYNRDDPGISYENYWKRVKMGKQLLFRIATEKSVKIPIYNVEGKEVLQLFTGEKEFPFKKEFGDNYRKNIHYSTRVMNDFRDTRRFYGLE